MKQFVMPISGGPFEVLDVLPGVECDRGLGAHGRMVNRTYTECAVTDPAQAGRLAEPWARHVIRKAWFDGLAIIRQAVRSLQASDLPHSYSAAGTLVETGPAATSVRPCQLVATAGADMANRAQFQQVLDLLCAEVPLWMLAQDTASCTIAAIAPHGWLLDELAPGSRVVVPGLPGTTTRASVQSREVVRL